MGLPLVLLALGSLLAGAIFMHLFIGSDQVAFWRGSLVDLTEVRPITRCRFW